MSSDFETPFFRDLTKFLTPILLGMTIGIVGLLLYFPVSSEVGFNIEGALKGYNIILDRYGSCFEQEDRAFCSSGAWPVSIFLILPIPILIVINIVLHRKLRSMK